MLIEFVWITINLVMKLIQTTTVLAVSIGSISCGVGLREVTQAQSNLMDVKIAFEARVGEEPFNCEETYSNLGKSEATIIIADYRFYISEVALVDTQGNLVPVELEQDNLWQYQNVALLDFEDKSGACVNGTSQTRTMIVGKVPRGDYQGLEFTLGVPSELNHKDATLAASPMNLTSMWWNWQGGYKFLRVDIENQMAMSENQMKGDSHNHTHQTSGFLIHIGSTGCEQLESTQEYQCQNPNRARITLDNFDPETSIVVADLAKLVADTDLKSNQPDTPTGCMSTPEDQDCENLMQNLGLPFQQQASSTQNFLRVE